MTSRGQAGLLMVIFAIMLFTVGALVNANITWCVNNLCLGERSQVDFTEGVGIDITASLDADESNIVITNSYSVTGTAPVIASTSNGSSTVSLVACPSDGEVYQWDAPSSSFQCQIITAGGTGGTIAVQEEDVTVTTTADTLDFQSGFDVTLGPGSEVNIFPNHVENPIDLATAEVAGILDVSDHTNVTGTDPILVVGDAVTLPVCANGEVLETIGGAWTCDPDDAGAGSTNSFETQNVPAGTDPVADSATDTLNWTTDGVIVLTGDSGTDTIAITGGTAGGDLTGTLPSPTIAANAVALATDTTGNYVATVADSGNANITVVGSGSENAAVTLDVIDVNCTDCLGLVEIADLYAQILGDTFTGNVIFDDGVTDSPSLAFTPATGAAYSVFARDSDDNLRFESNAATSDDVDIENIGAGVLGLTVEGSITGGNVTTGADPGHTHTGASLSAVDISADTNLAVTAPVTLTGDTVGFGVADFSANTNATGTAPILIVGDAITLTTCANGEVLETIGGVWTCDPDDTGGGGANSFETHNPDIGTSPVASSATDTLIVTSASSTIDITGNSATDTLTFDVKDVVCTDCLGQTEITGFVEDTGDTITGNFIVDNGAGNSPDLRFVAPSETYDLFVDDAGTFAAVGNLVLESNSSSRSALILINSGSEEFLLDVEGPVTLRAPSGDSPALSLLNGSGLQATFIQGDTSGLTIEQFDNDLTADITLTSASNADFELVLAGGISTSTVLSLRPAAGTEWDIFVENTGDDLQISVTSTATEVLDIVNTGAGDIDVTLDGTLQLSALDCTGNANGGALTTDASGNVTCSDDDGGAGGGDNVTVNGTAADTTANFLDGDIDFTHVDGGAGGPDDITATVACTGCVDITDLAANSVDGSELVDDSVDSTELDDTEAPNVGELLATDNAVASQFEYIAVGTGLTHDGDTLSADLGTSIDISAETNLAVSGTLLDLTGDTLSINEGTLTDENLCHYEATGTQIECTVSTKATLEGQLSDVSDIAEADGDTFTGVHDFGGATSLEVPNSAGGTTVNATGEITIDSTTSTFNFYDGTAERVLNPVQCGGGTLEDPTASEDVSLGFAPFPITVTEMRAVLTGSSTPSVTWTIRHNATDRSAAGNEVVTSGTTTTSTTSGSDVTSFNDATISQNSFIWLETTAQSGTVDSLMVIMCFRHDP